MKTNGHVLTAIKALEKQIDKYQEQAKQEQEKAKDRAQLADFYEKQAQILFGHIEVLKKNELLP